MPGMIRRFGLSSGRGEARSDCFNQLPFGFVVSLRYLAPALRAALLIAILATLGACEPPTEVIDLREAPLATQDAMLHVQILPLGLPAPPGVGSVGPISAYGCGPSKSAAASDAIQQLQAKALRMHATAVVDVLIGPGGIGPCAAGYSATANGIAVAARGIPPTY